MQKVPRFWESKVLLQSMHVRRGIGYMTCTHLVISCDFLDKVAFISRSRMQDWKTAGLTTRRMLSKHCSQFSSRPALPLRRSASRTSSTGFVLTSWRSSV